MIQVLLGGPPVLPDPSDLVVPQHLVHLGKKEEESGFFLLVLSLQRLFKIYIYIPALPFGPLVPSKPGCPICPGRPKADIKEEVCRLSEEETNISSEAYLEGQTFPYHLQQNKRQQLVPHITPHVIMCT